MVFHLGRMVKPYHTHLVVWFSHLILLRQASLVPVVATVVSSPSSPPCCVLERAVHLLPTGRTGAGSWSLEEPMKSPRSGILSSEESFVWRGDINRNHKEWRFAKPTWWVDQHIFKAQNRCHGPSKWGQKTDLDDDKRALNHFKFNNDTTNDGNWKANWSEISQDPSKPTPEVKGTSLRPPIRPRCATSPGCRSRDWERKAVSWVGPLPSNNCNWSFKSESGNLKMLQNSGDYWEECHPKLLGQWHFLLCHTQLSHGRLTCSCQSLCCLSPDLGISFFILPKKKARTSNASISLPNWKFLVD